MDRMLIERPPGLHAPTGCERQRRTWRWCVARTRRDGRLAAARDRPISPRNLERLFARRWWRLSEGLTAERRERMNRRGRSAIRRIRLTRTEHDQDSN